MCQPLVPELLTMISISVIDRALLASTAAAMGERQMFPKQTIATLREAMAQAYSPLDS
jgi:hypothetical protein